MVSPCFLPGHPQAIRWAGAHESPFKWCQGTEVTELVDTQPEGQEGTGG